MELTPFKIAVEEIVVNLLQTTGALELAGDNIIENAQKLGYRIVRKVVTPTEEFITLLKHEVVVRVVYVVQVGDEIHRMEMDAKEMIQKLKERDK